VLSLRATCHDWSALALALVSEGATVFMLASGCVWQVPFDRAGCVLRMCYCFRGQGARPACNVLLSVALSCGRVVAFMNVRPALDSDGNTELG